MRRKGMYAVFLWIGIVLAAQLPVRTANSASSAVIATAAADYSSGAHSVATVDREGGPRTIINNLAPTISDISVASFGRHFYRIERYNSDNISKFDISNPGSPIWQFSTMGAGDLESSNPHDMIFASATKAYVLRYGSTRAWVVNPSAKVESQFRKGQLNLSAYADADGIPEMNSGVIAKGKLFIVLQRLDSNRGWNPYSVPYLAVFNVNTNREIRTGKGTGRLKGIPLPIRNPSAIVYLKENDTIYVQGSGAWPDSGDPDLAYRGGIVAINPNTYQVRKIVDDGNHAKHPYGAITGMAIASKNKGYFVGYDGWGNNTLYRFNPTTGKVWGKVSAAFKNINIAGMNSTVAVDKNKMLWVCDATHARMLILNTVTDKLNGQLKTGLNPQQVVFVEY